MGDALCCAGTINAEQDRKHSKSGLILRHKYTDYSEKVPWSAVLVDGVFGSEDLSTETQG